MGPRSHTLAPRSGERGMKGLSLLGGLRPLGPASSRLDRLGYAPTTARKSFMPLPRWLGEGVERSAGQVPALGAHSMDSSKAKRRVPPALLKGSSGPRTTPSRGW